MSPFFESFYTEEPSSTLFPLPSQYLSSSMRSHLDDDRHGSDYYYYFEGNHDRATDMVRLKEGEMETTGLSSDYGSYAVYALCGQTNTFLPFITKNESISHSISTSIKLPKNRTKKSIRFSDHLSSILYFRSSLPVLNLLDENHASIDSSSVVSTPMPMPTFLSGTSSTNSNATMKYLNFSADDLRRSSLSLRLLSSLCLTVTLEKMELVVESLPLSLSSTVTPSLFLVGSVLVRNIDYEKSIFIRLSFDHWRSFSDYPAYYSKSFRQGEIDAFDFRVHVNEKFSNDSKWTPCFAVCYQVAGTQYWDNNGFNNYRVEIERPYVMEESNPHRVDEDEETCIFPFLDRDAGTWVAPMTVMQQTTRLFSDANFQSTTLSTSL